MKERDLRCAHDIETAISGIKRDTRFRDRNNI